MLIEMGRKAREASFSLANTATQQKNSALESMAAALVAETKRIVAANALDMAAGEKAGLSRSFLDRLLLTPQRIEEMAKGLRELIRISDPVGTVDGEWIGAQDIKIKKIRVPLGVLGIIYEARPNVTADAAGIAVKTGNAVILRGGSDAINSNIALVDILSRAVEAVGLPKASIQLVSDTSREVAREMMRLNKYIDVLIPRGGAGLIRSVVEEATIPVIETGVGNCHAYVHSAADFTMAEEIILNGKLQRPAVCNSLENLLVDEAIAEEFLPIIGERLREAGVKILGCPRTCEILSYAGAASEEDWYIEFNALTIAVKLVKSLEEACEHINKYGSRHSEVIITADELAARQFVQSIDAAAVYHNVSTRFTDGFQFGFGAEIGISTQKLHARGPMGLFEMTSYKYVVTGEGQIRK